MTMDTTIDAPAVERVGSRPPRALLPALERYALVAMLGLLIAFFSVLPATSDTFLTVANLRNLAANEVVIAIAALAAMVPLIGGQFDVSVGAVLGMVSVAIAALVTRTDVPLVLAIVAGVGLGALVGAINGFVIAYLGASSFVITLGMATLVGGLVSLYSEDQVILGIPQQMVDFGTLNLLGVPRVVWLLVAVALAVAYVLRHTVYGRQLLSVGANPRAARLVGIRVPRVALLSFVAAGGLAGVAGAVELARTGSGNPQVGPGYTLAALAAVFLGSTTIRPGRFNVPGTIVGVFFVAVSVNGLTLAGAADWVDPVFNGAAVVIAVAASTILARRRGTVAES